MGWAACGNYPTDSLLGSVGVFSSRLWGLTTDYDSDAQGRARGHPPLRGKLKVSMGKETLSQLFFSYFFQFSFPFLIFLLFELPRTK